ncbi:MAG TPA: MFS transporter [Candidatus Eremiobacteraceae bacterium]|nr:MFS transporter [Candidatus Eremiobacteraceae bacterium]
MKNNQEAGSAQSVRQLFSQRAFLAYFIGLHSFGLAYSIGAAAIAWQIFSLRHRPLDLGLVGLVLFAPSLLLALPAGVMADRLDRRLICIVVACAELMALLVFVGLSLSGSRSLLAYFSVIGLIGIAEAIAAPADRSLLVSVVEREQYLRATAFTSSCMQLIRIAAPAATGALIIFSTPLAFGVGAACYAVAATAYAFLPRLQVEGHDTSAPVLRSAIDGLRFILHKRLVLGAITLDLFAVLFGGAAALLPVYAVNILHVGSVGFGLLRAAPAAGAALVGAFLSRHPVKRRTGPTLLLCVAGFGAATIVFGVSKNLLLSLLALALAGGVDMVSMVIRNVLVQYGTPDPMRGRVNAVENVFIGASNELGEFESGAVAALLGAEASVVLGGVVTLLVVVVAAFVFPEIRKYDRILSDETPARDLPSPVSP